MSSKNNFTFNLPGSNLTDIPIMNEEGIFFSLGFVEIGCKHYHKFKQIKDKKKLFYDFWKDSFIDTRITDIYPNVIRVIGHYDSFSTQNFQNYDNTDTLISVKKITKNALRSLDKDDLSEIFRIVNSKSKSKELLQEIIEKHDAKTLQDLITSHNSASNLSTLRGKMAEILLQKSIEKAIPDEMLVIRNGTIKYFNERFDNGTEIDSIMLFYGKQPYLKFVKNLYKIKQMGLRINSKFN